MGRKRLRGHNGVNHVIMRPVPIRNPTVAFRLSIDFRAWKRRQDSKHDEVRVQVIGKFSKLSNRLMRVFAAADDDHGVCEDAVVLQQPHRRFGVSRGYALLESLKCLRI